MTDLNSAANTVTVNSRKRSLESCHTLKDRRTESSTKARYLPEIVRASKWLTSNGYDEYVDSDGFLVFPIPNDIILELFTSVCQAGLDLDNEIQAGKELTEEEFKNGPKITSFSSVGVFKSAFLEAYKKSGHLIPSKLKEELAELISGYRKVERSLKKAGVVDLGEAKKPLFRIGYT